MRILLPLYCTVYINKLDSSIKLWAICRQTLYLMHLFKTYYNIQHRNVIDKVQNTFLLKTTIETHRLVYAFFDCGMVKGKCWLNPIIWVFQVKHSLFIRRKCFILSTGVMLISQTWALFPQSRHCQWFWGRGDYCFAIIPLA